MSNDEERMCAYPDCQTHVDLTRKYCCDDCGARFCEKHLAERDGKRYCPVCFAYVVSGRTVVPNCQYQSIGIVWSNSNDLVKILNKKAANGWKLVHVDKKDESGSAVHWKCLFIRDQV